MLYIRARPPQDLQRSACFGHSLKQDQAADIFVDVLLAVEVELSTTEAARVQVGAPEESKGLPRGAMPSCPKPEK